MSMAIPTEERGRITARVSSQVAEKLQEAADLTGATMNQFLVQAALKEAERIIDRERTVQLSYEDAAILINLLDNPRPPNAVMTRYYERYKKKVENGTIDNSVGDSA